MQLKTKNWKLKTFLILALALFLFLLSANAFALSDMKAKIKVSGGGTYDYFVIGEMQGATDGFDNAYDTISPGYNMNDTYISTYFSHPEWGQVKSEFRGDIRSLKEYDEWTVTVYTNLSDGTALTMSLQNEDSTLPSEYKITVEDTETGKITDILSSSYEFTVSGSNTSRYLKITATATEEQCTYSISPASQVFGSRGGTGIVSVTASSGCDWTATSNVRWIKIIPDYTSGSGNGMVRYHVLPNIDRNVRTGTITIEDQTFTVTQGVK